jgi:hypothetical protein
MRQLAFAMLLVLAASTTRLAQAQAEYSASEKHISAAVGGTISIFQPDFAGNYSPIPPHNALAGTSPYPLIGLGVYLDVKLAHWVQLEVEGRRLRFDQYNHIYEDNYLAGGRVPICRLWKAGIYGKVLGGFSKMQFSGDPGNHGRVTDIAFGGSADIKMTRRITLRAIDFEYQHMSARHFANFSPYGASVGIAYRLF